MKREVYFCDACEKEIKIDAIKNFGVSVYRYTACNTWNKELCEDCSDKLYFIIHSVLFPAKEADAVTP